MPSCLLQMMRHAWNSYKLYAWGKNELKPISKRAHLSGVFGGGDLGASIVDGLDTLYLMGLNDEFREGRDWVAEHLHITEVVCLEYNPDGSIDQHRRRRPEYTRMVRYFWQKVPN